MALGNIHHLPVLRRLHGLAANGDEPSKLAGLSRGFQPLDDLISSIDIYLKGAELRIDGYLETSAREANDHRAAINLSNRLNPADQQVLDESKVEKVRCFVEKQLGRSLTGRDLTIVGAAASMAVVTAFKIRARAIKHLAAGAFTCAVCSSIYSRNAHSSIVATRFSRFNETLLLDLRSPANLLALSVLTVASSKLGLLLTGFSALQTLIHSKMPSSELLEEKVLEDKFNALKQEDKWEEKPLTQRFQNQVLNFIKTNPDSQLSKTVCLVCQQLPADTHVPLESFIKIVIKTYPKNGLCSDIGTNDFLKKHLHEDFVVGSSISEHRYTFLNNNKDIKASKAPALLDDILPATLLNERKVDYKMLAGVVAAIAFRSFWCQDLTLTLTTAAFSFVYTHIVPDIRNGLFDPRVNRLDSEEAAVLAGAFLVSSLIFGKSMNFFVAPISGYLLGNFAAHANAHRLQTEPLPLKASTVEDWVAMLENSSIEDPSFFYFIQGLENACCNPSGMLHPRTSSSFFKIKYSEFDSVRLEYLAHVIHAIKTRSQPSPTAAAEFTAGQSLNKAALHEVVAGLSALKAQLYIGGIETTLFDFTPHLTSKLQLDLQLELQGVITKLEQLSHSGSTSFKYDDLDEIDKKWAAILGLKALYQSETCPIENHEKTLLLILRGFHHIHKESGVVLNEISFWKEVFLIQTPVRSDYNQRKRLQQLLNWIAETASEKTLPTFAKLLAKDLSSSPFTNTDADTLKALKEVSSERQQLVLNAASALRGYLTQQTPLIDVDRESQFVVVERGGEPYFSKSLAIKGIFHQKTDWLDIEEDLSGKKKSANGELLKILECIDKCLDPNTRDNESMKDMLNILQGIIKDNNCDDSADSESDSWD